MPDVLGLFCASSVLLLAGLTALLLKLSLAQRAGSGILFLLGPVSLFLWFILFAVFPGPTIPFLSRVFPEAEIAESAAIQGMLPLSIGVLAAGLILAAKAQHRWRALAAALTVVIAAMPVILTALAYPIKDKSEQAFLAHEQNRLASHVALWNKTRPDNYRYSFHFYCLCPGLGGYEYTSEVIGGIPHVTYEGDGLFGEPPSMVWVNQYATIDYIFGQIRGALGAYAPPGTFGAEYDPEFGYPTSAGWDPTGIALTDDDLRIIVSDFEVIN